VCVRGTELTKDQERLIEVESTLTTAVCRRCGRTITEFHGDDQPIQLRHLPILGDVVYIRIRPKRFRCPDGEDHPTTTQRLSWYTPKALHTTAYEHHLLMPWVKSTIEDVGQQEETSDDAVLGTIERWMTTDIEWEALPPFRVLGMDEIALKKGHRDYVVISHRSTVHRAPHRPRHLAGSDQGDTSHMVDNHPGATPSPDPDGVH
jgi:transposase